MADQAAWKRCILGPVKGSRRKWLAVAGLGLAGLICAVILCLPSPGSGTQARGWLIRMEPHGQGESYGSKVYKTWASRKVNQDLPDVVAQLKANLVHKGWLAGATPDERGFRFIRRFSSGYELIIVTDFGQAVNVSTIYTRDLTWLDKFQQWLNRHFASGKQS